jgi:hypothetical protein
MAECDARSSGLLSWRYECGKGDGSHPGGPLLDIEVGTSVGARLAGRPDAADPNSHCVVERYGSVTMEVTVRDPIDDEEHARA